MNKSKDKLQQLLRGFFHEVEELVEKERKKQSKRFENLSPYQNETLLNLIYNCATKKVQAKVLAVLRQYNLDDIKLAYNSANILLKPILKLEIERRSTQYDMNEHMTKYELDYIRISDKDHKEIAIELGRDQQTVRKWKKILQTK